MANVVDAVSRVLLATQYTGGNGAAVLAMCQNITQYSGNIWTIDSDDGATLRLRESNPETGAQAMWPVMIGQYCVVAPDTGIIARMAPGAYSARYKTIDSIVQAAVADQVDEIAASAAVQTAITQQINARAMYGGFGVYALPTLLPGATSSPLAVTIEPAQPDTGYVARAFAVSGAAVLTSLSIVSRTNTSGSVCTVVVKNNGVASIGGLLLVHVTSAVGGASPSKS